MSGVPDPPAGLGDQGDRRDGVLLVRGLRGAAGRAPAARPIGGVPVSAIGPAAPLCAVCGQRHGHHLTCARAAEIADAIAGLDAITEQNAAIDQAEVAHVVRLYRQIAGLMTVISAVRFDVGNEAVDEAIARAVRAGATLPAEVLVGVTGVAADGVPVEPVGRVTPV